MHASYALTATALASLPLLFFPVRQDEFPLVSTAIDTWVGQYVRITAETHTDVTGLIHTTGGGWVSIVTGRGEVKKRAADLIVIPAERANLSGGVLRSLLAKALAGEKLPPYKETAGGGRGRGAPPRKQAGRGRGGKGEAGCLTGPLSKHRRDTSALDTIVFHTTNPPLQKMCSFAGCVSKISGEAAGRVSA